MPATETEMGGHRANGPAPTPKELASMQDAAYPPRVLERFWAKVDRKSDDECWKWTDSTAMDGYGAFWNGKRKVRAHRFAYELLVGPIPEGLQIDHLCRVRHCVNPAHLEPVTQQENIRRGEAPAAKNARKTHCKRGHEFTPENIKPNPNGRACRQCDNDLARARYHARKKGGSQ